MDAIRSRNDAIVAIATPPGRGGVGVVRVSGPNLGKFTELLLGRNPLPRRATLAFFKDDQGNTIDQGIALYFSGPASYTGEDVLELQGHGGPVLMQMLLNRCVQLGARLAAPGEFTQRAFLNDKLDLVQAESVADLIEATTETAARLAMRSLRGEFSNIVDALVQQLVELRVLVEAVMDFPDEDLDGMSQSNSEQRLAEVRKALKRALEGGRQGSILRSGLQVVLTGRPNVGKSSLLNRLSGENVAIVTPVPGTTRDALRQTIQIDGVPLNIIDTAGLRETSDEIESMGIQRTWEAVSQADLLLFVLAANEGLTSEDQNLIDQFPAGLPRLLVYNKMDLSLEIEEATPERVFVSAKTGAGLPELKRSLLTAAGWRPGEDIVMARHRHLDALKQADTHLESAEMVIGRPEFFAEELRLAQQQLCQITGEFTADDLLGEIFSRFCIGK